MVSRAMALKASTLRLTRKGGPVAAGRSGRRLARLARMAQGRRSVLTARAGSTPRSRASRATFCHHREMSFWPGQVRQRLHSTAYPGTPTRSVPPSRACSRLRTTARPRCSSSSRRSSRSAVMPRDRLKAPISGSPWCSRWCSRDTRCSRSRSLRNYGLRLHPGNVLKPALHKARLHFGYTWLRPSAQTPSAGHAKMPSTRTNLPLTSARFALLKFCRRYLPSNTPAS